MLQNNIRRFLHLTSGSSTCTTCLKRLAISIYVFLVAYSLLNYRSRVRYLDPARLLADPMIAKVAHQQNSCKQDLSSLSLEKVDIFASVTFDEIRSLNTDVESGGRWSPPNCSSWQKVAIIIPYRDRLHHLQTLLYRLHPMLRRQLIQYQIFVVEQLGSGLLNRGMLRNVGALVALEDSQKFNCFIFHDVDMLPEHDLNLYLCNSNLHHLSSALDEMRYHVMFGNNAGGVVAINRENLLRVNGYSNSYWGWGNEDDDFSARTEAAGLLLTRPLEHIGRYKMIRHVKQQRSGDGNDLFLSWRSRWKFDGLNSLNLVDIHNSTVHLPLYTHVTIHVKDSASQNIKSTISAPTESWLWFLIFYIP